MNEGRAERDPGAGLLIVVGLLRERERRPEADEDCYREALTLQIVFPTSSATSKAPRLSIATPTGRP